MTDATGKPGFGQQSPADTSSEFNTQIFLIQQMLGKVRTAQVVKVLAVTPANNDGQDVIAGTVDVQILVNQLDGIGQSTEHIVTYSLPYFRLQAGGNAIIIDPQVGDLGLAVFCDRDISAVKAAKAAANPGSFRRFDIADGLYIGGFLNKAPTQYIAFRAGGIIIVDANSNVISMEAGKVAVTTELLEVSGKIKAGDSIESGAGILAADDVQAGGGTGAGGNSLLHHMHTGVQTGGGISGPPEGGT